MSGAGDEKTASIDGPLRRGAAILGDRGERPATLAQQTVTFLCAAPRGHVRQFAAQTGGSQINFALPSGERKEAPGVTPHADKYSVCDPGPVTLGCKAPLLDHWCMGSWLDVDAGLNSENDDGKQIFAATRRDSEWAFGARRLAAPRPRGHVRRAGGVVEVSARKRTIIGGHPT
jgi:hypothetical protein